MARLHSSAVWPFFWGPQEILRVHRRHHVFRITHPRGCARREDFADTVQVLGGQGYVERTNEVFEIFAPLRFRDWDNIVALRQHPRHLKKTPADLMDRQDAVLALRERVSKMPKPDGKQGLTVAIHASVGSSKQKTAEGKDVEAYRGRDTIFGSVAWGRKSETIVLIAKTDNDPLHDDCPRQYSILVRNGWAEHFWMSCTAGVLHMVERPAPKEREYKGPPSKNGLLERNILSRFKPGERVLYSPELGVSEKTYYGWVRTAAKDGLLDHRVGGGKNAGYFVPDRV